VSWRGGDNSIRTLELRFRCDFQDAFLCDTRAIVRRPVVYRVGLFLHVESTTNGLNRNG
jgi:hypothetical protein